MDILERTNINIIKIKKLEKEKSKEESDLLSKNIAPFSLMNISLIMFSIFHCFLAIALVVGQFSQSSEFYLFLLNQIVLINSIVVVLLLFSVIFSMMLSKSLGYHKILKHEHMLCFLLSMTTPLLSLLTLFELNNKGFIFTKKQEKEYKRKKEKRIKKLEKTLELRKIKQKELNNKIMLSNEYIEKLEKKKEMKRVKIEIEQYIENSLQKQTILERQKERNKINLDSKEIIND